jgi:hypothetical protein
MVTVTGKASTPPLETTSSPRILTSLTGASAASTSRGSTGQLCARAHLSAMPAGESAPIAAA